MSLSLTQVVPTNRPLPSRVKARHIGEVVRPRGPGLAAPVETSQTRTSPEARRALPPTPLAPVASFFPSGENARQLRAALWPLRVTFSPPLATSHSRTVRSALPVASTLPSA